MDNLFNHIKHAYINLLVVSWDLLSTSNNHQASKQLKNTVGLCDHQQMEKQRGFWLLETSFAPYIQQENSHKLVVLGRCRPPFSRSQTMGTGRLKKKNYFYKKLEALAVSIGYIPPVQPPTNMAMHISHFLITTSTSQKSPPRSPTLKNDLHLRHWATPTCEWCYREGVIWRMFKGVTHPVEPCETSMLLIGWTFQQKRFLNHGETPGEALRRGRFDYNIWLFNIQNSSQR